MLERPSTLIIAKWMETPGTERNQLFIKCFSWKGKPRQESVVLSTFLVVQRNHPRPSPLPSVISMGDP